jgi:hypothetical protein
MYISKETEYTDFLWYSGWSNDPASEGTWTLNDHPGNPSPVIGIVWHRNLQDNTGDIKYTNIVPGGQENGGYIFHGTTTDTTYNAFYNIYNKGKDNLILINWNCTTLAGQVSDSLHFGDSAWHCWDSNLEDL